MHLQVETVKFHNVLKCLIYTIFHIINNQYYFIIHTIHNSGMALTVSCEWKERKFSCPYCIYESKDSSNMRRHIRGLHSEDRYKCQICLAEFKWLSSLKKHLQKHSQNYHSEMTQNDDDNNLSEKEDNVTENQMNQIETVSEENKYIESILNKVKTDFERKRELGKMAMEMIDKYELNVHEIPQEIKNAIKFNLMMEGK